MSKIRKYREDRERQGMLFTDKSLAVQASKDECDINVIVKKYLLQGIVPEQRQAAYADVSEMTDLRDAIHMVNDAQEAFMELDANIRRRFDNDPVKLVEFAADPKNWSEAVKLGLAKEPAMGDKPKAEAPVAPKEPKVS